MYSKKKKSSGSQSNKLDSCNNNFIHGHPRLRFRAKHNGGGRETRLITTVTDQICPFKKITNNKRILYIVTLIIQLTVSNEIFLTKFYLKRI